MIYCYCTLDLGLTIVKIIQNDLQTNKILTLRFWSSFWQFTRSTVLVKSNYFKGCFKEVKFNDFQNFCQGKVVVEIFWPTYFEPPQMHSWCPENFSATYFSASSNKWFSCRRKDSHKDLKLTAGICSSYKKLASVLKFLFQEMTEVSVLRFQQNRCF